MMTDTPESVTLVPIDRIEVLNSRDRNMKIFEEIVENIRSIGLKKPITVTEREPSVNRVRDRGRECLILCVSDLGHAVFRYDQASKRPANIMAS
jgi:hypothetical protein